MFDPDVIRAIRAHAEAEFPRESCGLVVGGAYLPMDNLAQDPESEFAMPPEALLRPGIQAVVHSHPAGPDCPSEADMAQQIASGLPWGIVTVCPDGEAEGPAAREPFFWGDGVPRPPLKGREFRHGVTDCYALCRDWHFQETGELLPDFPRPDEWWAHGGNLLLERFREAGFETVPLSEARRGDGLLFSIRLGRRDDVVNHCAVLLDHGMILHHLAGRLSRQEHLGGWRRFLRLAIRRRP
ncbi:C40 family peptidase [Desulfovibrio aminophilus]|uniref:C40 family peptidase n=1 Tax=Desulfovibrio aminophilus TaxID=81425 RepID=UPI00040A15D9|nr:C40 family peptidase [Desulfovibrio aminophilus]